MRVPWPTVLLSIVVCVTAAGCDESLSTFAGPTPNLEPTFSSIQSEIFNSADSAGRLACTQCHNAIGSRFNGLDLTAGVSYTNLVNRASVGKPGAIRVIPGDPENSYLIHKLEGRAGIVGVQMPFTGPKLTSNQIFIIERWIELGARND